ncbi:MAG: hypothetical protein HGB12_06900 [Bacteroidetes bacterium]|nr:hypothetical protein [Bacteroidota bacterium]
MKNFKKYFIEKTICKDCVLFFFNTSILFSICFSILTFNCSAQGVAINFTGDTANTKAMLDIDVTGMPHKAGLLIPRITTAERDDISLPIPESLLIYNTTTKCLEIYVGTAWQAVVCGCTSKPAAAGIISGTATVCPGQNAVLYSVPAITGASSYTWSYSGTGASIVGSTSSVIIYFSNTATAGNLSVMGTNACGNGTVSSDYPIAVNSTAPNITGQPENPTPVCAGTGSSTFTVTATGGLTYQWQEFIISWNNVANAGVYSNVTTATLTITNPPLIMNTYKYRCIVSGTCTSSTSDGVATLTVNPIPSVTNVTTATICSGTNPNIALTSSVPCNFTWTTGTVTGDITGASASSGSTINQILTNPSNATAGSVQYIVTPTSITGSCVGATFTITVTVNPTPTVTNTPLAQTICTGGNTTLVAISSNAGGSTFTWTASASEGISGFTASGSTTLPVQTIINPGSTAGTVTYAITPTANTCVGEVTNYITTVNPLPTTVTASASPNPICSGTTLDLTGSATGTTTWSWTGPNSFTSSLQNPTITNFNSAGIGVYTLTASNACGSGTAANTNSVSIKPFSATGGTITYTDASGLNPRSSTPYSGGYTVHTFTSSGTFTPVCNGNIDALVVAGGGGGGNNAGAGGGAGGFKTATGFAVTVQEYTVSVGSGGSAGTASVSGTAGQNSVFSSITSSGGGYGTNSNGTGGSGGSGGGGSATFSGGSGISGEGYAGGNGNGQDGSSRAGAGGGGAGAVGQNTVSSSTPGTGGVGLTSSISGISTYYAGGGGGASHVGGAGANGGNGGGGKGGTGNWPSSGTTGTNGSSNTGGGGGAGGGGGYDGGAGGSGIVIIRYPN